MLKNVCFAASSNLDCFVRSVEVLIPANAWERTFMIYKYERICRNENLTEEHIKKIDNGLHALTQAKYREEQAREKYGVEILSSDAMMGPDGEVGSFEMADPDMDVEEIVMHKLQLERLHEVLAMLDEEDSCFIMEYFEGKGEGKFLDVLCVRYGLSKKQANTRMHKIVGLLQELF